VPSQKDTTWLRAQHQIAARLWDRVRVLRAAFWTHFSHCLPLLSLPPSLVFFLLVRVYAVASNIIPLKPLHAFFFFFFFVVVFFLIEFFCVVALLHACARVMVSSTLWSFSLVALRSTSLFCSGNCIQGESKEGGRVRPHSLRSWWCSALGLNFVPPSALEA